MIRCRSLPDETWAKARKLLIFYFSRRHGRFNADDLAHDTIAAMIRSDYEFEAEADFMKICNGFARNILFAELRKDRRMPTVELDPDLLAGPKNAFGLSDAQMDVLWRQTYEAIEKMQPRDREAIREKLSEAEPAAGSGKNNVRFFRAKERLKRILNPPGGVKNDADPT